MDFGLFTFGAALLAGALSTLSPCVLPLVPILIASAVTAHRLGVWALAAGLALSFTVIGVFLASVGLAIGLDASVLRNVAAVMFVAIGVLLLSSALQTRFAAAAAGFSSGGHSLLQRITLDGLPGQFVIGLILGVVWTPCTGPTLGAAITLASQGQEIVQVAAVMVLFGIGAAMPLVLLGLVSRQAFVRLRGHLLNAGQSGKKALGGVMLVLGLLILTGLDKSIEAVINAHAPDWWITLTTSI